jgi:hypothetical protein
MLAPSPDIFGSNLTGVFLCESEESTHDPCLIEEFRAALKGLGASRGIGPELDGGTQCDITIESGKGLRHNFHHKNLILTSISEHIPKAPLLSQ